MNNPQSDWGLFIFNEVRAIGCASLRKRPGNFVDWLLSIIFAIGKTIHKQMVKRYAANLLYCAPDNVLRNGVVEINEQTSAITDIFSLDDTGDEMHSTVFLNGILLPFNPFFTLDAHNSDLFQLLEEQFLKNSPCEISCHKKMDLWLLQGDDLLTKQTPGKNWTITHIEI